MLASRERVEVWTGRQPLRVAGPLRHSSPRPRKGKQKLTALTARKVGVTTHALPCPPAVWTQPMERSAEGGQPIVFHLPLDRLKLRFGGRVVETRAGLRGVGGIGTWRRGEKRVDLLMTESGDFIPHQIAAHHPVGEAFL